MNQPFDRVLPTSPALDLPAVATIAPGEQPTVSVVVLNYNGLKHLETCFRSLLALDGTVLVESDGATAANPDGLIVQNLLTGIYFLKVESLGSSSGSYVLSTQFQQAQPPLSVDRVEPAGPSPIRC